MLYLSVLTCSRNSFSSAASVAGQRFSTDSRPTTRWPTSGSRLSADPPASTVVVDSYSYRTPAGNSRPPSTTSAEHGGVGDSDNSSSKRSENARDALQSVENIIISGMWGTAADERSITDHDNNDDEQIILKYIGRLNDNINIIIGILLVGE